MAPATRASASAKSNGQSVRKPMRKGRSASSRTNETNGDDGSASWAFLGIGGNDDVRQSVEDRHDEQLFIESSADVEAALNPLREMANKVGKEVELFATRLDQFLSDLPMRENKYVAAQELVSDFRDLARDAMFERKKKYDKDRAAQLRKEWSEQAQISTISTTASLAKSTALSARSVEEVKELRQYEQEADIWDLFSACLELEKLPIYRPGEWQGRKNELYAKLEEPHVYTSEASIWERFLVDDDLARERFRMKKWLEQTAEHQENDLEGIVAELEARSGTGKGLWTHGWMNTREKIKGEKRLRTWPRASENVLPQIMSTDGNEMLVTTLDPDAPARQQRKLEKLDQYYEKAVWIATWEMLRRGQSRKVIKQWFEEQNEGWRSALLSSMPEETKAISNSAWRSMCYLASESECSNDYEAAVYGLLGGNIGPAKKVCRTVDDHLFVHYSTALVRQFEAYLGRNYPERVKAFAGKLPRADDIFDSDKAADKISELVAQLRSGATRDEAFRPQKVIEGYLMARQLETLMMEVGNAISDLDSMRGGTEQMVVRLRNPPSTPIAETHIASDTHALRIVTHMYTILRVMDSSYAIDETASGPEENLIAAYIQSLRAGGKRDAVPLYATQISRPRQDLVVAKVLQDITQNKEQKSMLNLLDKYDLQTVPIITSQLGLVLDENLDDETSTNRPFRILEDVAVGRLHPGQQIMEDFYPDEMTESDVAIVNSLQWVRLLNGYWEVTFSSLSLALRKCLVAGRFACAAEIVRNFPYAEISSEKSYQVLGRPLNLMEKDMRWPEAETEEAVKWELMRRQSRTYFELEQLIHAVEALADWVAQERPYTRHPVLAGPPSSSLKQAKTALDEAMQPLLAGSLRRPVDDQEAADLQYIRKTYLPEVIIAYNTALYTAGPTITRDSYIDSMDLSVAIASESSGLAECFQQAGRMRELVSSFAQSSKMMLVMKAGGRPWKSPKEKFGKDLGVWEIGHQGNESSMAGKHDVDVS